MGRLAPKWTKKDMIRETGLATVESRLRNLGGRHAWNINQSILLPNILTATVIYLDLDLDLSALGRTCPTGARNHGIHGIHWYHCICRF